MQTDIVLIEDSNKGYIVMITSIYKYMDEIKVSPDVALCFIRFINTYTHIYIVTHTLL